MASAYKKHGLTASDIKTSILLETSDPLELKKIGEYYSELWDIVNSKEFANLKPENGDGGWGHLKGVSKSQEWREFMSKRVRSDEEKKKMSDARKGIVFSEETRRRMSESRKKYTQSEETNAKRAASISKVKKGVSLTEEHKLALKKPKDKNKNCATCEICGILTTKTVISRNHGKGKCNK